MLQMLLGHTTLMMTNRYCQAVGCYDAVGLILNVQWAYKLAWFPGAIFVYHGLSFWFWVGEQNKAGHPTNSKGMRIGWTLINLVTGILTILVAWIAS